MIDIKFNLMNINKGYRRLWYLISIFWIIFAVYYYGVQSYDNLSKKDKNICKFYRSSIYGNFNNNHDGFQRVALAGAPRTGYMYLSYDEVPLKILYFCSTEKITRANGATYIKLSPRYITAGRFGLIVIPPLLLPFGFILYLWVRDGFEENGKSENK